MNAVLNSRTSKSDESRSLGVFKRKLGADAHRKECTESPEQASVVTKSYADKDGSQLGQMMIDAGSHRLSTVLNVGLERVSLIAGDSVRLSEGLQAYNIKSYPLRIANVSNEAPSDIFAGTILVAVNDSRRRR